MYTAALDDELMTLYGAVIVIDFQSATLAHGLQVTPNYMRKVAHLNNNCQELRIKSYDCINVPWHLTLLIKVFRSFLSKKLKSRFFVHTDVEALTKRIPEEILPVEYGGTNGSINDLKGIYCFG